MAGPWEKYQRGSGGVFTLPPSQQDQINNNRNANNDAIRNANDAQRIRMEQERIALERARMAQAERERAAALAKEGYEIGPDGKLRRMENWQPPAPALTPAIRQDAINAFNMAKDIGPAVNEIERTFNEGPAKTKGFWGMGAIVDRLPIEQNQRFDRAAGKLRGSVKSAQGFTGGEGNTATEMQMNIGQFIPSSSDYDNTTRDNIAALWRERARGMRTSIATLGGIPDANGRVTPVPEGYVVGKYPDLDAAVAENISRVPQDKRQAFIIDALRRFNAKQAKRGMFGRKSPAGGGKQTPKRPTIDIDDYEY